jgi:hypothetical protein
MMSGGEGGRGRVGGVKKCFLSLRPTALLWAESKKKKNVVVEISGYERCDNEARFCRTW